MSKALVAVAISLLLPGIDHARADESRTKTVPSWAELLDRAKLEPGLEPARNELVAKAREAVGQPIVRRAHTLQDVGKNRTWLDGRSNALEDEIREAFALAMSDFGACRLLSDELPLLSAAYRLTGDPALLDRIVAQLEKTATWSPLQRPGWTLYTPGNRLPPDGKDGNWLATGCGVRALGDTLDLLPAGVLDGALLEKIHALLEGEIAGVVDDWQAQRPWFVRSNNPITNQWVLPTEGLVRACLVLGVGGHRDAYELGVKNLLAALDAHGKQGEFEEGFGYASFTVTSMLHTARAMAAAGDRRAIDHPFLANFPAWLVHHFQPGNMVINCFDAGGAFNAADGARPLLSLLSVCTGSPVARWALAHQWRHSEDGSRKTPWVKGPSNDVVGLAARALEPVGPEAAPPLFAYYERATRVNWRDGWEFNATGVWVRGGHPMDQHDHQDRGHVNFISRGRPILIESGTPSYDHKLMMTHYTTGMGHNVLQLGLAFPDQPAEAGKLVSYPGWQKAGGVAPITVHRLDATGGELMVDGSACYDDLAQWRRDVTWRAGELIVNDHVRLAEGRQDIVLFRWHLGTEEDATITPESAAQGDENASERHRVVWTDAEIDIESSAPVAISQTKWPDNTLEGHTGGEDAANIHTCIVVQTRERQAELTLITCVRGVVDSAHGNS
jgi:hypothetical protein